MTLRIGIISDLHFGPRILFHGRLRKMSDMAPELTVAFVQRMNELKPDLVLTLGDIIEDESLETDANRYRHALRLLSEINAPVRHVYGNHDTINQTDDMIREAWNHQGELYYSFDCKGYHVSVLRTVERPHIDARLPSEQLEWLRKDLEQTTLPTVVAMHHGAADQNLRNNPWFENAPEVALIKERKALRSVISSSPRVRLVLNGHLHWTHVGIHDAIPYVTVQSLTENLDPDAPGRVAAAWALVELSDHHVLVRTEGAAPSVFESSLP